MNKIQTTLRDIRLLLDAVEDDESISGDDYALLLTNVQNDVIKRFETIETVDEDAEDEDEEDEEEDEADLP